MYEGPDAKLKELTVEEKLGVGIDTNSTNASAISVITPATALVSAGAETRTLPNGREGQLKHIFCTTFVAGGIVITPASLNGYTAITIGAAGRGCILIFCAGKWNIVALGYATAA